MRLAIFSESPADEAAIRVLVNALLGALSEPIEIQGLRLRGWAGVFTQLQAAIRYLHYNTDADGLIIVVDSDLTHTGARSTGRRERGLSALPAEERGSPAGLDVAG